MGGTGVVPFSQIGRQGSERDGQTWGEGKEGEDWEEVGGGAVGERPDRGWGVERGEGEENGGREFLQL